MHWIDRWRLFVGCIVLVASAQVWAANPPISPAVPCKDLLKLQVANTTVSEAIEVPAGQPLTVGGVFGPSVVLKSLPAHCLVHGEVNHHKGADGKEYGDKFEIRMPLDWQGRLLFQGGGGLDGVLNPALALKGAATPDSKSALHFGYAVVSTDGGHKAAIPTGADGSFGSDPDARADYNYRSTKSVTDVARQVIAKFYGRPIQHSYFEGCSNGGREGLKTAQLYPDYFDGIIAGAPAFNLTHAAIAQAWATVKLASIAPRKADGSPDLPQSLTENDLKLLVSGLLDQCDALDGLKDGLIFNPEACHFDPAVLKCKSGENSSCLSSQKIDAIQKIFAGPHDSSGKALYSSFPYDSGDAAEGWRVWMTGFGPVPSINVMIFPPFLNGVALAGAPPPVDIFSFNFDTDSARIEKASAEINATSTDWSAFRKHAGKLLLYNGMSDPVFSGVDLIRYYKQILSENGGENGAAGFARLFLVPGMNHCGGGPGLDDFDALTAIQDWVEQGKAPDVLLSSGKAFPGRTRPLCAYPKFARYDGKGNPEDAASFTCSKP
jgi:Tannase and feruloyl esterase